MDSRSDRNVGAKRKTLCRNLNDRFLASDVKRIIFTDEEDFSVRERERAKNHQNNRVYGQRKRDIHPARLYYESSRFSRKVMVLVKYLGKEKQTFILLSLVEEG